VSKGGSRAFAASSQVRGRKGLNIGVATSAIPKETTVTKNIPAPRRAGTDDESIPQWLIDELRNDPALLREVAALMRARIRGSRAKRRR
jgi:hypothetical protein